MTPALYGTDLWGEPIEPPKRGKMADTFMLPPFTVLNAREGFWQERKAAWIAMGIQSEVGRDDNALNLSEGCEEYRQRKAKYGESTVAASGRQSDLLGNRGGVTSLEKYDGCKRNTDGTSIFDPVLCELAYRWFCPAGGLVLDPFAGGSVRGIVASCLGRQYFGVDLRPEQLEANRVQAAAICDDGPQPEWVCGDSRDMQTLASGRQADLIFSCPPYGNLEVYSDDPRDLSTLDYSLFRPAYQQIIVDACKLLKHDRFACFVVGDFRDKSGNYNNFVAHTVNAFREAGLHYYNEAILVTAVGSLPIRVGKQFNASRKLGKTHQNVLVFVKGDGKRAAQACGQLEEFRA
jgi:DNA modification methylase